MKRTDFVAGKKTAKHKKSLGKWVFAIAYVGKDSDIVGINSLRAELRNGKTMVIEPQIGKLHRDFVKSRVDSIFTYVEDNKL